MKVLTLAILLAAILGSENIYSQSGTALASSFVVPDKDMQVEHSSAVAIKPAVSVFNISPVQNLLRYDLLVRIESDKDENASYRIYGPTGLLVASKDIKVQKGFSIVMLNDKGDRAAGMYVIEITTLTRSARTKVVRIK